LPRLDPKDLFLLGDGIGGPATPAVPTSGGAFPTPPAGPSAPTSSAAFVPWLRKTEYISREVRTSAASEPCVSPHLPHARLPSSYPTFARRKHAPAAKIDVSRPAQIRDIEGSFAACAEDTFDLAQLRHPTKPDVRAVESFEVLPDADVWANAYDLFRFSERPGDRALDVRAFQSKRMR
jgi:RNA polymerase II-associated factor 1